MTAVWLNTNYFRDSRCKIYRYDIFSLLNDWRNLYSSQRKKPFVILFNRLRTFLYARHYLTSVIPAKKRATLHLMTSLVIILTDRRIIAPYFVFSFRFVAIQQFNIADDHVIIAIPYTTFSQNKRS